MTGGNHRRTIKHRLTTRGCSALFHRCTTEAMEEMMALLWTSRMISRWPWRRCSSALPSLSRAWWLRLRVLRGHKVQRILRTMETLTLILEMSITFHCNNQSRSQKQSRKRLVQVKILVNWRPPGKMWQPTRFLPYQWLNYNYMRV